MLKTAAHFNVSAVAFSACQTIVSVFFLLFIQLYVLLQSIKKMLTLASIASCFGLVSGRIFGLF